MGTHMRTSIVEELMDELTLDVPWLELVEVDVGDDVEVDALQGHLLGEVVGEQLLLRRVEPEPRRHHRLPVHGNAHDRNGGETMELS